ncbi:AAA family ATPase [Halomonas ramblicola]|uniref:AAA family ATPase n=1 Tax=Halomonas ramblicola TaxID=747349 RepID=UPI0025B3E591|nr:ATP-binding protein [Halomonas ramblicola]MDN3522866.1 ATP-binding protein [Halomonas ramblicola]
MRQSTDAGQPASEDLDSLVDSLVAYHASAARHPTDAGGDPARPLEMAVADELPAIRAALLDDEERRRLDRLGEWFEQDLVRLRPLLEERRRRRVVSWAVQHPGSRLRHAGRTLLANAIGRDLSVPGAELHADPASDVAALLVGLEGREASAQTRYALDRYLRRSGDYPQARLLSLFGTCHALSAARRALERRPAPGRDPEHPALLAESMAECRRYLALAERIAEFRFPPLVIAVGVCGSGKSRFTRELVTRLGAIRVSSDAERRRLFEPDSAPPHPQGQSGDAPVDIFGEAATGETYRHLAGCAGALLDAGIPACVDATCLVGWQRDLLRQQAEARGLPCLMVSFEADEATLRRRIEKRARQQGVPVAESLAILAHQRHAFQPFGDEERMNLVHLDTTAENAAETLVGLIAEHVKLA